MSLNIKTKILNFATGNENYFHPRATLMSDNSILMTLQTIGASDYFGDVQYTFSDIESKCENWTKLNSIPGFEHKQLKNREDVSEGICDVVPDYHEMSGSILAMGCNNYYRDGKLYEPSNGFPSGEKSCLKRFPVYSVMNSKGKWITQRKKLEFPGFDDCSIYVSNCSQRIVLENGQIILPFTFGYFERDDRLVTTLLCDFNGKELSILKRGNILELPVERGLLEPSIVFYRNKFFLTLRAEDDHGYLSASSDGLNWEPIQQWRWEDGTKLTMSTTQQHWLKLGGKLYLTYTRKDCKNDKVFRWRSPLFIAEFDMEKLCLKKDTEQIVFPMRPHSENPESIGSMGNFHPLALSKTEAIVTVGEMHPQMNFSGDTLLAYLSTE